MSYPHDQTLCPKCGRMYCEGFWDEGVCVADMHFSSDPTARGDQIAFYLRYWYEKHRESLSERYWKRWEYTADEFMLGLIQEVHRISQEAKRQMDERKLQHDLDRFADDGNPHGD